MSGPNIKALDSLGSLQIKRESAESAEYMELSGALKDADCEKVEVDGGVSSDLGCCDRYQPESDDTKLFNCGNCEYVREVKAAPIP